MKARETLVSRGMVDADDRILQTMDIDQGRALLLDKDGVNRTRAALFFSRNPMLLTEEIGSLLLKQLMEEKKLYTRLAITEALEHSTETSIPYLMCEYLGMIGNNQLKSLPERPSKKTSYPLPRDIIARSLGRMKEKAVPAMLDTLFKGSDQQVREVIDALGFNFFYNRSLLTEAIFQQIYHQLRTTFDDDLMSWKFIIFASALSNEQGSLVYEAIKENKESVPKLFEEEWERTRRIISKRQGDLISNPKDVE